MLCEPGPGGAHVVPRSQALTLVLVKTVNNPTPNAATIVSADQFDPNTFNNTDSLTVVLQ
jgi:hypothetical protein